MSYTRLGACCLAVLMGFSTGCSETVPPDPGGTAGDVAVATAALTSPLATPYADRIGGVSGSDWALDVDGDGLWGGCGLDRCLNFGVSGDIPIAGTWRDVDNYSSIGVYRPSDNTFYLDYNGDGIFNGCTTDRCYPNFVSASLGNRPVVGQWNSADKSDGIGMFRSGTWWFDTNHNGTFDTGTDRNVLGFGPAGVFPVVGKLAGDSVTERDHIGYFSAGSWHWDKDANFRDDGCTTDGCFTFGQAGDNPILVRMAATDTADAIGTYRASASAWYVDRNHDRDWDACTTDDCLSPFAGTGQQPITGNWPPVAYSSDGDRTVDAGHGGWENSAAVIAPGTNASCPNGRAFFADGLGSRLLARDLTCSDGACGFAPPTPNDDIYSRLTNLLSSTGSVIDSPGTDNATEVTPSGALFHVRIGSRLRAGRVFGAMFVWRSLDCGNTWTVQSKIEAVDTNLFGGKCGLPQRSERPAVFRPSDNTFYVDMNSNGVWDGTGPNADATFANFTPSFNAATDQPVMGQWDPAACRATGATEQDCLVSRIGMFSNGAWKLDLNGNGKFDAGTDLSTPAGATFGQAGDFPIVGHWNAPSDNRDLVGVWRNGTAFLDTNGNLKWDGCSVGQADRCVNIGQAGDRPVTGVFSATAPLVNRKSAVGVYRPADRDWFLDTNDNGWDGCGTDRCVNDFGTTTATPLAGFWDGSSVLHSSIGTFEAGSWTLDRNGNGVWDQCTTDLCWQFGQAGDIPLLGRFRGPDGVNAWFGGWDRVEMDTDIGNRIYLSAGCDFRQSDESVLFASSDSGNTWQGTSLEGPGLSPTMPMMLASSRGSRLFVYGLEGTTPRLWMFNVSGTTLNAAGKYAVGSQAGRLPWALAGNSAWDGSENIAFAASNGTTDYVYITYPSVVGSTNQSQVLNVRKVAVTPSGSQYSVSASTLATLAPLTGSVIQAVLVEGPNKTGSNLRSALVYWKESTTSSGTGGTITERALALAETASFVTRVAGPTLPGGGRSGFVLSTDASGNTRSWDQHLSTGDYLKGASFLQDGVPSYLAQWIETPTMGPSNLHAALVRMRP